eukprot:UN00800
MQASYHEFSPSILYITCCSYKLREGRQGSILGILSGYHVASSFTFSTLVMRLFRDIFGKDHFSKSHK